MSAREGGKYGTSCLPTLLRPASRGTLRLRSKDPADPPAIDPNYLEKSEDVDTLLFGKEG